MRRLVHVTTVPDSLIFIVGQPAYMRAHGWATTVVSSPGDKLDAFAESEGVPAFAVPMARAITPGADVAALARLVAIFRELSPDVVHAHTPKGGLLGTIAAFIAGVPVRVYHMRGLPLVTLSGPKRALMTWTERVSCALATRVLCHSASLRDVALAEGLAPPEKLVVLAGGGNGVDAHGRFDPARTPPGTRDAVRRELDVASDALVVLFVGRLVRDKGLVELMAAWAELRRRFPAARLVVAGPFEPRDPVPDATRRALESDPTVRLLGFRADTERLYAASDVLVLPTYREGFPNVPIEAASMGLPVVATRVTGCTDAVADGVTGTLVPPRDATALAEALGSYLVDPILRATHGAAGRARVLARFTRERMCREVLATYEELTSDASLGALQRVH